MGLSPSAGSGYHWANKVMASGNSTLSVPTLLFLSLDAAMANGTNRVALLIECVAGVRGFHDQR
ncbi:MAG TPA: hypothetical protein DGB85_05075 [Deltaproteobacteria bacterium]|nr:hypothetical protein [Deltaproteobacteria bacterium]